VSSHEYEISRFAENITYLLVHRKKYDDEIIRKTIHLLFEIIKDMSLLELVEKSNLLVKLSDILKDEVLHTFIYY
jgi:phage anti-repressor protein